MSGQEDNEAVPSHVEADTLGLVDHEADIGSQIVINDGAAAGLDFGAGGHFTENDEEVDGVPALPNFRHPQDEIEIDDGAPQGPSDEEYRDFRPMKTVFAASMSMMASFVMILAVFIVPGVCDTKDGEHVGDGDSPTHKCPVHPFSLLIYSHSAYWLLHLLIDPYLKYHHKQNRMQGYLLFYLDTKNMRRAPFYAVSVANFALVLADVILNDFCDTYPKSCENNRFMRVDWLRGLISIEALAIMALFTFYISKIHTFNKGKFKPDVMRPEIMHGLGVSLVLKFPELHEAESTEEEETHRAGFNRSELRRLRILGETEHVYGNTWKEADTNIRMMQAELIAFLIRQIKRKNRKVVTLTHHLARFTDDVQGLVAQGIVQGIED